MTDVKRLCIIISTPDTMDEGHHPTLLLLHLVFLLILRCQGKYTVSQMWMNKENWNRAALISKGAMFCVLVRIYSKRSQTQANILPQKEAKLRENILRECVEGSPTKEGFLGALSSWVHQSRNLYCEGTHTSQSLTYQGRDPHYVSSLCPELDTHSVQNMQPGNASGLHILGHFCTRWYTPQMLSSAVGETLPVGTPLTSFPVYCIAAASGWPSTGIHEQVQL